MAIRSQKSLSSVNIWPGYVDVLATLLIVTIFTVMISTIAQRYFNDVIGEKTSEISELDKKIFEIGKALSGIKCKIIFQHNILITGLVVSLATLNQFIFK